MRKVNVYNTNGEIVEQLELSDKVFGVGEERNIMSAIHNVVVCQIKRMKRRTSCTKTRAEVSGGGIKPYKQKGTGRARQGSIRSPQWKGGGIVFGPRPISAEEKNVKIPKKMKRLAVKAVLSSKFANEQMLVIDKFELEGVKTKNMSKILENIKLDTSAIIMLDSQNKEVALSARNIPNIKVQATNGINIIDLLKYDKFIVTKEAVAKLEEVYA